MSDNSDMVIAHTRRELEMAGAFTINEELDGSLGRGVLAAMKAVQRWCHDNQDMREAIGNAVQILCKGGLLSDVTDNPDEWQELAGRPGTWANKRNPFYVSSDAGKNWHNIVSNTEGKSKEVTDVREKEISSGPTNPGGEAAKLTGTGSDGAGSEPDDRAGTVLEKDAGMEVGPQHGGIQRQSIEIKARPQGKTAKYQAGEKT